jgi:hypothetical protein
MFHRKLIVPPKALGLWLLLVPGGLFLGCVGGSWIMPGAIAIWCRGLAGLWSIRTEWHLFAHAPVWIDPVRDSTLYDAIEVMNAPLALGGGALLGYLGARLCHYLVVKKFRWMTEEDVKRTNRTQYF